MGRMTRWSGVAGNYSTDSWFERLTPKLLTDVVAIIGDQYAELRVDFKSSGSSDTGTFSVPPERCYPPEFDDERTLVDAWFDVDGARVDMPRELQQKLFDHFIDEIDKVELKHDDSGQDRDRVDHGLEDYEEDDACYL